MAYTCNIIRTGSKKKIIKNEGQYIGTCLYG